MAAPPKAQYPVNTDLLTISDAEFQKMRALIYDRFGINLTDQKRGLLVTRLQKFMKQSGFTDFHQYYDYVVSDRSGQALSYLADQISTNHTFFFREKEHFDFLNTIVLPQIVPGLKQRRQHDFRLWCAAASTGEEPYGLAMTLMEYFGTEYSSWKAGLLATDISIEALETAKAGIYPEESVSRIPKALRDRYFQPLPNGQWQVKPHLQKEVTYRRFNLMNPQFPFRQAFHVIFCRNVMIYFDDPTVQALVNRMYQHTEPGGYLFVGHAESLGRIQNPYEYIKPAVYRRPLEK